jgi:hypothetical protein
VGSILVGLIVVMGIIDAAVKTVKESRRSSETSPSD